MCVTNTQSVKMCQRKATAVCQQQFTSGNMAHGLNAALLVEQVRKHYFVINKTGTSLAPTVRAPEFQEAWTLI